MTEGDQMDETESLHKVRELHQPRAVKMVDYECALGACDHGSAEDCPTRDVQVCTTCFGLVEDFEPEVYSGDELEWPCATAVAAGAVSDAG